MNKAKPQCKYGSKCYRKNPQHLNEYSHESSTTEDVVDETGADVGEGSLTSVAQDQRLKQPHQPVPSEQLRQPAKKARLDDYFKTKTCTAATSQSADKSDNATVPDTAYCASSTNAEVVADNEMANERDDIKHKFLIYMPEDFYDFWDFAKSMKPSKPRDAFLSTLGLQLVGPYDVLAGRCKRCAGKRPNYLRHWRYYFDPPEFLTVIRGDDKTQFHLGYYRDDPKEMPVFVASNEAADSCAIKPRGDNIFAAVCWFIEDKRKSVGEVGGLTTLLTQLKSTATLKGYSLDQRTARMKDRDKKVVARCFHGAGIVVPVDKNGVGYRPLPETPGGLRKILQQIVESKSEAERDSKFDALTEIVTLVQFANDECDYGEGLELGIDVFCHGAPLLHNTVLGLLPLAYQLLGRHEFANVIRAHLADRRRTIDTLDELL